MSTLISISDANLNIHLIEENMYFRDVNGHYFIEMNGYLNISNVKIYCDVNVILSHLRQKLIHFKVLSIPR